VRDTFGRYKVLDRIGTGSLGDLFRARDTRTGRTVALRLVSGAIVEDPDRLASLLRSARAATTVSHPAVAALYEVGEADGFYYLACEFVDGQTLSAFAAGNPLSPRRVIEIGIELADALAEVHARELAHGDVSVDTVMITRRGRVKLIDFGLVSNRDTHGSSTLDEAGDLRGLRHLLNQVAREPTETNDTSIVPAAVIAAQLRAALASFAGR